MSNDIYITHMIINMIFFGVHVLCLKMIIVCLTCNITLPRRRGSRPDGARFIIEFRPFSHELHFLIGTLIWLLYMYNSYTDIQT